ncbi:UNVERIFIED_ORG: hypothetical protein ABIC97_003623 [Peribacillus simplex]
MFGNQLTEEQRQNGLMIALGIGGVAGAAKVFSRKVHTLDNITIWLPKYNFYLVI